MEKYFANYNQSLALKELGFDEPCFAGYRDSAWIGTDGPNSRYFHAQLFSNHQFDDDQKEYCSAPLKSQVFEWFREKYNLRGFIGFRPNVKKFDYHMYDMSLSGIEYVKQRTMTEFNKDPKVGTFEEAESACIDKLIEIVQQNL